MRPHNSRWESHRTYDSHSARSDDLQVAIEPWTSGDGVTVPVLGGGVLGGGVLRVEGGNAEPDPGAADSVREFHTMQDLSGRCHTFGKLARNSRSTSPACSIPPCLHSHGRSIP